MSRIEVASGKIVDPYNFSPDDYNIDDVAHSLSNICRFGGHCKFFYSVAQHAYLCATYAQQNYNDFIALYCLHHDDSEAYVGDCVSSLKSYEFKVNEDEIMESVWESLDLNSPSKIIKKIMKHVDNVMCATEAQQLIPSKGEGWFDNIIAWDYSIPKLSNDFVKWGYLNKHEELLKKIGDYR